MNSDLEIMQLESRTRESSIRHQAAKHRYEIKQKAMSQAMEIYALQIGYCMASMWAIALNPNLGSRDREK